jgi:transposase
MKHYKIIECPFCQSQDTVKNGHSRNGEQRWRCNTCKKSFQLNFVYNANKPGVHEKIFEMTINASGVRDIGRTLKISPDTVSRALKKKRKIEPLFARHS